MKEIRNVQVTGRGTFIVSLPKEWVKSNNLKPQDKIVVIEQEDSSLAIYVWKEMKEKEDKVISLNLEEYKDFDSMIRECIACYLVGYNKINLKFGKRSIEYKDKLKEVLRNRLVGIEFLEENIDSLLIQVFSMFEMYLDKAFNRLYSIVYLMLENLSSAIKEKVNLFPKISKLDDEVDRFYNLITRQINIALSNIYLMPDLGISRRSELIEYRLNGKTLERIADHIQNISDELNTTYNKLDEKSISDIINEACNENVEELLKNHLRYTEIMKRKFRHNSTRSFLVLRNYKGYKISVNKQQLNSQTILEALEKIDPNFPIIEETLREIMEDVMDVPKAKEILKRIKSGEIKYIIKEFPIPSPFSHTMLVFGEA
ncbi:MAG: PhoU domain-containing protein, partial [Thermoproteota archaeon]